MKRSEMYILKNLGFQVHVSHPYIWVINFLRALELIEHDLAQFTWNYVNDRYGIDLVFFVQLVM
jgi:hypothetical protein